MRVDATEWDGANTFTMNVFAVMFFLSFLLIPFYKRTLFSAITVDVLIGVSSADLFDRLVFHIVDPTAYDVFAFICIVIVILIDQFIIKQYRARKEPV